jgi:hypothetical protein
LPGENEENNKKTSVRIAGLWPGGTLEAFCNIFIHLYTSHKFTFLMLFFCTQCTKEMHICEVMSVCSQTTITSNIHTGSLGGKLLIIPTLYRCDGKLNSDEVVMLGLGINSKMIKKFDGEISGSHSDEYEDDCLLGCSLIETDQLP